MGRPYSNDLRERVVRAVIKGGLSRHQAAAQFGVGISTAINWVQRFQETGSVKPDQIGGYRPKKIVGPHRDWLIQRCRKDFTVRGLVAELAAGAVTGAFRLELPGRPPPAVPAAMAGAVTLAVALGGVAVLRSMTRWRALRSLPLA